MIPVTTAQDMYRAVLKIAPKMNVMIKAAAVADYRVEKLAKQKIKKLQEKLTLTLVKNPDILKKLGQIKKKDQILVGFAAETQHLEKNALKKLKEKNCDWLILNDVSKKSIGFGSNQNAVTLYSAAGEKISLARADKSLISQKILNIILSR